MRVLSTCLLAWMLAACGPSGETLRPAAAPLVVTDTLIVEAFGPVLGNARAIAADPRGMLHVVDAGASVVLQLTPDGQVIATLGGPGTGDHAFLSPSGIDPTSGLVWYIADRDNGRIQRFSHEGRLLETILVPADPGVVIGRRADDVRRGQPVAVAEARAGDLFVVEASRQTVLRFDERRVLERIVGGPEEGRGALRRPVDLALGPDGRLFVADADLAAVVVFDAFGNFLRRLADGLAVDVRAVATSRERVMVVLPRHLLVYLLDGTLDEVLAVEVPDGLVGAAITAEGPVLLTQERIWRPRGLSLP